MHTSHSTGENRLLGRTLADFNQTTKTSTRGTQVPIAPTQQTFTNRTPAGSANYAIPLTQPSTYGTVSTAPQIVPTGYNIKNDPTYIGNMGPSAGESWSGGTMRSDGTMAGGSNANPYMTIEQKAQAYADSIVKPPEDPAISRDFNAENMAKEQAKQAYYAKLQADTIQKRADAERKYKQMLTSNQQTTQDAPTQPTPIQSTAVGTTGAINTQTQPDLTMRERASLRGDVRGVNMNKQDFIEQKRAEGMSDAQIRQALAVLPPDTFKTSTQQTPPPTPPPTPQPTPTGSKETQGAPEQQNVPPPVTIPPNAQAVGDALYKAAVASGDPMADLRKAIYDSDVLREEQAKQNALISLGASIQDAEQGYTDTQAYIDKWTSIATQNSDKLTNLLQTQNEETNKVLEQQKSNALQKLEFDKQVQTQQLERQKAQDVLKSSIAIALRGGAYSGAAQESLASAEREWDIGIQNLAKEFSFKAADVTTDLTSKYVTAKQNLALNLYNASQELSNKIEGYANAGFASLQAKKKAITEARNSYRTTIDKIQEDHSKNIKDMTKEMGDQVSLMQRLKYQEKAMDAREEANFKRQQQINDRQANTMRLQTFKEARSNMEQLQSYKALQATDYRILNIDNLYATYKKDPTNQNNRALLADALQYSLNKFNDPTSAVLIGEYKRYVDSQGGIDTIKNSINNFIEGGGKITPSMLDAMVGSIKTGRDSALSQFQKDIISIKSSVDAFNYSNPDHFIDLGEIVSPDYLPVDYETKNTVDTLFDRKSENPSVSMGTSIDIRKNAIENGLFIPSPISVLNEDQFMALPRADRHNNPTAFTTDIAKQAGLIEGVDYAVGDTFPSNNKYKTAFLLGDPIDTTIKVIDSIGFKTKSGDNRWTYTDKLGLDNSTWQNMPYDKKVMAIKQMNRYEGGTGILFSNIS